MTAKRFREIGEQARFNRLFLLRKFFIQLADQPRDGGMLFERISDFSSARRLILCKQRKDNLLLLRKMSLQIASPEVGEPGGGFSKLGLIAARTGLIQVHRLDQRVMMIVRQWVKTLMAFHVFRTFSLLPSHVEAERRYFSDGAYLHACRIKRAVANFEQDARQRPSRRPGQRPAGLQIKRAVVTGT